MELSDTMATEEQSRILTIPRELRNDIYSRVGVVHTLTCADVDALEKRSTLILQNSLNVNLLRTCKQIHDEYDEIWSEGLDLMIFTTNRLDLARSEIPLHKSLPVSHLLNVTQCVLTITLSALYRSMSDELSTLWHLAAAILPAASLENIPWTPSKYMAARLRQALDRLATWISPEANVNLLIYGDAGIDPLIDLLDGHFLQPVKFKELESNVNAAFSRNQKLSVHFSTTTPLRMEIEEPQCGTAVSMDEAQDTSTTITEAEQGRRLITRGDGSTYHVRESAETVRWFLKPLSEIERGKECSFAGLKPIFCGTT
ncbi:hypothetical protein LTR36_003015 [Oleoguttula mirabilis]|uniref:Uncharacterized protein n=1 Tax=Oleoguttula mirabilis TaxID=1507867 RepID=A0AAV9JWQ3_9PEZI|nr:hypothetical protein LTR36_003015 [Oleoguttula mirabilis]